MSIISGGGGLASSSLFSVPSWQTSTPSFGDTTSDVSTGLPSGMPDWSSTTSTADLNDFFSNAVSDFASTWNSATTSELSGLVNNAAAAAAKRLGVTLPSSSSSSSTNSSTASTSKTSSSSGQNIASKNIDGVLAALDGHPQTASTGSSSSTPFNFQSFLNNLNNIASGVSTSNVPATPTGKNFSIDSYLATLDSIAAKPKPTVNVTT